MCSSALFLLASSALAPGALSNPHNPDPPYKELFVPMTGNNGYPFRLDSLNPQLHAPEGPSRDAIVFCWEGSQAQTQDVRLQFPAGSMVASERFWISEPQEDYNPHPDPKPGWELGTRVELPQHLGSPPTESQGFENLYIIADGVAFELQGFVIEPSFIYTPTEDGPVVTLNIVSEEESKAQGFDIEGANKTFVLYIGSGVDVSNSGAQFLGE